MDRKYGPISECKYGLISECSYQWKLRSRQVARKQMGRFMYDV